jgi:hypothetical protein
MPQPDARQRVRRSGRAEGEAIRPLVRQAHKFLRERTLEQRAPQIPETAGQGGSPTRHGTSARALPGVGADSPPGRIHGSAPSVP